MKQQSVTLIFLKIGLAGLLFLPELCMAASLNEELAKARSLRTSRVLDAADHVETASFRYALEVEKNLSAKETALWEAADIQLEAANKWPDGQDNGYAKRAIAAWVTYIDFAIATDQIGRVHRAVEYAQRSYLKASEFQAMYEFLARIKPKYVNDKALTRWEDRLRTCSAYAPPPRPWREASCIHEECKGSVAEFYGFSRQWLTEFPLAAQDKQIFAARMEKIPKSCRGQ